MMFSNPHVCVCVRERDWDWWKRDSLALSLSFRFLNSSKLSKRMIDTKHQCAYQWHANTVISVCLHDTGHWCVVSNTQRRWNQWLHRQKRWRCGGAAQRAALVAVRVGGLAPSIFLAQWHSLMQTSFTELPNRMVEGLVPALPPSKFLTTQKPGTH